MRVLLVSCYELGHQPLHVAAPAGHLRAAGHEVRCLDLSVEPWDEELVAWSECVAFSVPMHTAMRIAREAIERTRATRPELPIACFGLYAPLMADVADRVLGGETDATVVSWVDGADRVRGLADRVSGSEEAVIFLGRDAAAPGSPRPARDLLPGLEHYARLVIDGEERLAGYLEASHGCSHRCRHCPVPVVYDGRLRIVDPDSVIADAAQQVARGARHLTFGDPDFLNGVHHSRRVVRALHERFPAVTFDCTTKVEHILRHADIWAELAGAGCLFVISAFETLDDDTLVRLDKGHTAADAAAAVALLRTHGIEVRPSWMPFTPWTTLDQIRALLDFVAEHDLVGNVDPVQYTIRLLLPEGSLLLEHPDLAPHLGPYDAARSSYRWRSADPAMDQLQADLAALVERCLAAGDDTIAIYQAIREACRLDPVPLGDRDAKRVPRLTEPWFCCAEPTERQLELTRSRQSAM